MMAMTGPTKGEQSRVSIIAKIRVLLGPPVLANAVKVSLFVGTCLNAINQGPAIWRGEPVVWSKFALNFLVPFLVSGYSAAKVRNAKGC